MIVWGTKRVERTLGRVADFCPMCRDVRAFRIRKISMVGHVYFVGLGRGETVGHVGRCELCGFERDVDPTRYAALAKARSKSNARQLMQETFPDIAHAYAERFELERELRRSPGSIDRELREELIREALQNAAPAVEARYAGGTTLDSRSLLALLGTVVAPIVLLVVAREAVAPDTYTSVVGPLAGVLCVAGFAATLFLGLTSNRRWMRSHLLPMLARALRPLRPTEEELDRLLEKFRAADLKIGKKLRSRLVCRTLEDLQTRAPA